MQPCRFAVPAGWQPVPSPSAATEAVPPLGTAPVSGIRRPPGALACLCAPPLPALAESADPQASPAYVVVLTPLTPEGELLGQLAQGVEQDLAGLERTFGGRPLGRSPAQQTELGAGPVAFQAIWLRYPAASAQPAHPPTDHGPPERPEAPAPPPEGRLYLLLERRADGQTRRVPLLFIGGPDALPAHLAALHALIASLTLSPTGAAAGDAPQPVHTPWSD